MLGAQQWQWDEGKGQINDIKLGIVLGNNFILYLSGYYK
jgi:hypothetical protein